MSKVYQVFNILTRKGGNLKQLHELRPQSEVFTEKAELILNAETFYTTEDTRLEFRFTFKNRNAHFEAIEANRERYDYAVEQLKQYWADQGITWERYTSDDHYISEFEGYNYVEANGLYDWRLTDEEHDAIVKNLLPLGSFRWYLGDGEYSYHKNIQGCRLLKERTGNVRRFGNAQRAINNNNFPSGLITYSIEHAIDPLLYINQGLFKKMKKLCYDVEDLASKFIDSCNYAACITGHESLGSEFLTHSHRLDDSDRHTLTIALKLSDRDSKTGTIDIWYPFEDSDPFLPHYYMNNEYLSTYASIAPRYKYPLHNPVNIMSFNASLCAHTATWTDDVYIFFVYEHVNWKPGAYEFLSAISNQHEFSDLPVSKRLTFWNVA